MTFFSLVQWITLYHGIVQRRHYISYVRITISLNTTSQDQDYYSPTVSIANNEVCVMVDESTLLTMHMPMFLLADMLIETLSQFWYPGSYLPKIQKFKVVYNHSKSSDLISIKLQLYNNKSYFKYSYQNEYCCMIHQCFSIYLKRNHRHHLCSYYSLD